MTPVGVQPFSGQLPRHKGSYLLLLELVRGENLAVGRLGSLDLSAGLYAYAGNARGPGGLNGRLTHHLKPPKRRHWHIDYLRTRAPVVAIWAVWGPSAAEFSECRLIELLRRRLPFQHPFAGFGSSDCTCHSHLLYWPAPLQKPLSPAAFRKNVLDQMDQTLTTMSCLYRHPG